MAEDLTPPEPERSPDVASAAAATVEAAPATPVADPRAARPSPGLSATASASRIWCSPSSRASAWAPRSSSSTGSPTPDTTWSTWKPEGRESSYPSQIADFVSGRYRNPDTGRALVSVMASQPQVQTPGRLPPHPGRGDPERSRGQQRRHLRDLDRERLAHVHPVRPRRALLHPGGRPERRARAAAPARVARTCALQLQVPGSEERHRAHASQSGPRERRERRPQHGAVLRAARLRPRAGQAAPADAEHARAGRRRRRTA